ncbi:DUF1972 domain-containing protein [Methylophaga nitratireducenticrescens]|uniref:Alpha-D-GlcNAc alpha-1,2-L-rhamnosyltransferase n=1 Tax=Methylophaga nitratireducenticrescens TaxID=754476 RepID=I1XIQ0_METNJ|nr:DUF1972 domain-containing protein [Methylophaga nitratireducenticrescens]AFI84269.1 glycosyl transferase [Methylophaga nitratireducenticrescens]AUZ84347.1 glycosyl transferase [Methylophaga nitratireducenticrescens]
MAEDRIKSVAILGIRGLPAAHGGFETFVEYLVPVLVKNGWKVTVYCQHIGTGPIFTSKYKGVELVHIPVKNDTPWSTIIFDWKATRHACRSQSLLLTLGYNTGFLAIYCRIKKVYNVINMDGIEWKRGKWSLPIRIWFYLNERIACLMGDHLIADHPEIKKHLQTRVSVDKITMIPYGAESVETAKPEKLKPFGLQTNNYAVVIARLEPENSILEIVQAFSQKPRDYDLVILGNIFPEQNDYHGRIKRASNDRVKFLGAIYDPEVVQSLRYYSRVYIHGHTVGGTNPSLVEALGAGCCILAHENAFNRWVTQEQVLYFNNIKDCSDKLDLIFRDDELNTMLKLSSRQVFHKMFEWLPILKQYEKLLEIKLKYALNKSLLIENSSSSLK